MGKVRDGFAYLEELKQRNRGSAPTFSSFTSYLEKKAKERGVPLNGQFELTPMCNLRCGMCYVRLSAGQMRQPLLRPEEWNGLISQACRAGMLCATLTGGECLTYPGFREVYEHLQALGCEVTLMTNGVLLDEAWLRYFRRHRPGSVYVTLYGDSEDAYERVTGQRAFEAAVRHIRAIREADLPLMMSVTPCRLLGEDVFGTIRLAKELSPNVRVNSWLCTPRQETGRADVEEDLSQADYIRVYRYQQELDGVQCAECPAESLPEPGGPVRGGVVRGLRCGGERSSFSVNWRGVMSPCNELEMIETYPLRDGFDQAWQEVHRAVLEWPRAAACEGCAYAPVCVPCAGRLLRYGEPGTCPADLCGQTMRYVQQGVYSIPACE